MASTREETMWSHQQLFRLALETITQGVMTKLGIKVPLSVWLVGLPSDDEPLLSVETEDSDWDDSLLAQFPDYLQSSRKVLKNQKCSTLECAENFKRRAYQHALKQLFESNDLGTVFVGYPEYVAQHLVAPVIRIAATEFCRLPRPKGPVYSIADQLWKASDSLLDSSFSQILNYAGEVLKRPQPGRDLRGLSREYVDICRAAAKDFMHRVAWAAGARSGINLFECCNEIASLYHEGLSTRGRLLFCRPSMLERVLRVEFRKRVPITETGWSRKLVGVSSSSNTLVVSEVGSSGLSICGIGSLEGLDEREFPETFIVDFTGHHRWQLSLQQECLMHVRYGLPSVPSERMNRAYLGSLYEELFPDSSAEEVERILALADTAMGQHHGTMLVITAEAETEALRLQSQGTSVVPTPITPELLGLVTSIDGAVLLDPQGQCHGVGVILDGPATPDGSPARGARYNAAIRYQATHPESLVIVVSEDGPVDVFPQREPEASQTISRRLQRLKQTVTTSSVDGQMNEQLLHWLNDHRSYFQQSQCGALDECIESLRESVSDSP